MTSADVCTAVHQAVDLYCDQEVSCRVPISVKVSSDLWQELTQGKACDGIGFGHGGHLLQVLEVTGWPPGRILVN